MGAGRVGVAGLAAVGARCGVAGLGAVHDQRAAVLLGTQLLEDGSDIRTIQELLGYRSVKTTMIYTHVLNRGYGGVRSPLDGLAWSDE